MTPKQLMLDALTRSNKIKKAPLWELEFHLWSKFSEVPFVVGTEFNELSTADKEVTLRRNVEVVAEVSRELGFSAVNIPAGYWEVAPQHPAYFWLPDPYRHQFAAMLVEQLGEEILFMANTGGVLAMPESHNYIEFSYLLFDDPQKIDDMAVQTYRDGIESLKRFRDIGYTTTILTSDIADNHGPYFSPPQMERFVLPYLRDYVDAAHQMGIHVVMHTDGNINSVMDQLVECGVDAIQSLDPIAGMDISAVREMYGDRITVCGNVDCGLLLTASPEEVYQNSKQLLEACASRGSYVFGASNAVQIEVPKENYLAMNRAWKEHIG